MKHKFLIFSIAALVTSLQFGNCVAGPLPGFYTEVNLAKTTLKLPNGSFKFSMDGLKLGYNVNPKIAIEAQYMKSLGDENIASLNADIASVTSLYLRFGSDIRKNMRSYFLLGQSNISLDYSTQTSSSNESLQDFSWAIGAEERLRRWPLFIFNAEYVRHYDNNGSTIRSTSIGLRYEF